MLFPAKWEKMYITNTLKKNHPKMPKEKPTAKQLEALIKKADKVIQKWSTYKDKLQTALSSNPPGNPPRPPKG